MIIPNIWENKKWQPNHQPDLWSLGLQLWPIPDSGWWFEPLWKIWKSIGMISNPIYGKIKKCSKPPTRSHWKFLQSTSSGKMTSRWSVCFCVSSVASFVLVSGWFGLKATVFFVGINSILLLDSWFQNPHKPTLASLETPFFQLHPAFPQSNSNVCLLQPMACNLYANTVNTMNPHHFRVEAPLFVD